MSMAQGEETGGRPLTGRKVLAICIGAFGIIIAVNLVLAVFAVRSFPGLEVQNSYVASQNFNEELAAQLALGWEVEASYEGGQEGGLLILSFTGAEGRPAEVAGLAATLGRATHVRDDITPDFAQHRGTFTAPVALAPGNWNIRLVATAPDGTEFRQRVVLRVPAG
jgi:nitrogen fixation protein FixH